MKKARSSIVGHHDRIGLKDTRHMISCNSSHGARGCSTELLKTTGGEGLFYCSWRADARFEPRSRPARRPAPSGSDRVAEGPVSRFRKRGTNR